MLYENQNQWMQFLSKASEVKTSEDYFALLRFELRGIFPYGMLAAGIGYMNEDLTFHTYKIISVDFPFEYVDKIINKQGALVSPIASRWIASKTPQLFDPRDENCDLTGVTENWLSNFRKSILGNLASHGMPDIQHKGSSYFSFHNIPEQLTEKHAALLRLLIPILHSLFLQVQADLPCVGLESAEKMKSLISLREKEILTLVAKGLSNKQVARDMHISENAVRNHLTNAGNKLQVNNRFDAVHRALQLNLIEN